MLASRRNTNALHIGAFFRNAKSRCVSACEKQGKFLKHMNSKNKPADAPDGLIVNDWSQWDQAIGMAPQEFYEGWIRGLPGRGVLSLEFSGGGQGHIDFTLFEGTKIALSAERNFDRPRKTMQLKELRVTDRGQGLGKQLLRNQIDLAARWGVNKFTFKAGREAGPYFWSRRYAHIPAMPGHPRDPLEHFQSAAKSGLDASRDALGQSFCRAAQDALRQDPAHPNIALAYLQTPHRGQGQMRYLFQRHIGEFPAEMDLADVRQLDQIRRSLDMTPPKP